MEDFDIINLIYNRQEIGLENLKKKYNDLIYTVALSILNNESDSDESVNDTYLKTWRTIPPYKPTFLKSFVCKIVRQISIDKYRVNSRKYKKERNINELDYEISSEYSLEDELYKSELVSYINLFLEKLDIETQILFIRRYFMNEGVKSLSNRYGITENLISVKLSRVKVKLKKYLELEGYKIEKS